VLTVRLAAVNVQRRQMDYDVVAFAGERPSRRGGGAERLEPGLPEQKDVRRAEGGPNVGERKHAARAEPGQRQRGRREQAVGRPGQKEPRAAPRPREQARRTEPRQGEVARTQGKRPHGAQPQRAAPVAETARPAGSPHPGFDRLRALAAQSRKSGGKSASHPDRRDRAAGRDGGQGEGRRGPKPSGSRGGKPGGGRESSRPGGPGQSTGRNRRRRR
jgi:ribonuclease R